MRYTAAAVKHETPLQRLCRMLEQHLGRELTHEEKRLVSLSTVIQGIEADPTELEDFPPKAANEE